MLKTTLQCCTQSVLLILRTQVKQLTSTSINHQYQLTLAVANSLLRMQAQQDGAATA
jgi:hypothetical protein